MTIEAKGLCFSYGSVPVLDNLNLTIKSGELVAFLGPNGVGKTTLFRCLLGFLPPKSGTLRVEGKPIASYPKKELAKCIAYIPQSYSPAFNHTVLDSVLMGVTNQLGTFDTPGKEHEEKALKILQSLGIESLADRGVMKISGGERQLMLLGRALMQDAKVLIMDEPTANLDFGNSYRVMKKISRLVEQGYSVLFSTHDPNQALSYATRVITMKDGRILSDTDPVAVSGEILTSLYGVDVSICKECSNVHIMKQD